MLTEPGDALRTLWGFRRSMGERLWDGIARERLELWAIPALEAFGQDTGIGLAIVDGMNGRILGLEYNDAATPISAKKLLMLMNRQGPHDYPSNITTRGKTHIFTGWTEPIVHDGKSARLAGIRSPKRKPVVGVSGGEGFASLRNTRYYWTRSARSGVITGATNATPIVITDVAHGLTTGYVITISGVTGNTAANGTWVVNVLSANTFELNGSVGNGAYIAGGTWLVNEFFVRSADTTNPGMNQNPSIAKKPSIVRIDGAAAPEGSVVGALAAGEWEYGDLDALGYSTIYVRLTGDVDPDTTAVDFIEHSPMRIDSLDGNVDVWISSQTTGMPDQVTVTNANADLPLSPAPFTVAHLKIEIEDTVALGHLCEVELDGEVIPPANANSFYLWVYVGGSGFSIAPNTLKIRWTDAAAFAGKEQTFIIAQTLNAGWNQIFFDYIAPSDVPGFDIKSIALVLEQAFAPEVPFPLELRIDEMTFVESSEASGGPGQFRARFSWFDSKRFRESDPSPISDAFFIADGATLDIDISGHLPGIDSGSQNIHPGRHSIVDPDHAWVLSGSGTSNYYLTDSNGENPVVAVAPVNVYANGLALTSGTLGGLAVSEWAYGDSDSLGHDTIYVRLADSADPATKTDAYVVYEDNTVDRVKIYIHRDDFGEDEFGRLIFGLVSPDMGNEIPFQTGPDFLAPISISAGFDQNRIVNPVFSPNYFRAVPEPVESVALDNDVIIGGGQGDFAVGKVSISLTNMSVVSPVPDFMNTPRFLHWMEGRDFLVAEDPKKYFIAQVYSSIGYGKPDRLRVASIDPYNTDAVIDGYVGASGDTEYRIPGRGDMVFWTAKTAREGVYTEAMPLTSRLDCRMTGDSVRAVGRIREVLMVAGRKSMYNIVQDKFAIDDLFGSPPRFAMPLERRGFPGIMARRSQVTFADGNVGFLGQDTDLVIGSGLAFQKNPLSQRVRGFLNDIARIDTEKMLHAHSVYKRRRNCKIAHLIEFDANAGGCETKEQVLTDPGGLQNPPTVGPGNILTIGEDGSFASRITAAVAAINTANPSANAVYLNDTGSEDFENVTDLTGIQTLIISDRAEDALDPAAGSPISSEWNPPIGVSAKLADFVEAGGNVLIFANGFRSANSTNPATLNSLNGSDGPGHAYEWLSSSADPRFPGSWELSYRSHVVENTGPRAYITRWDSIDGANKGFFFTGHYLTKNMAANPLFTGSNWQPADAQTVYDWNAQFGLNPIFRYFRIIPSGVTVVARAGAERDNAPPFPRNIAKEVVYVQFSIGAGKVVMIETPVGLGSFWTSRPEWSQLFFENVFNYFGLI